MREGIEGVGKWRNEWAKGGICVIGLRGMDAPVEIGIAESISCDKFVTGNRISVLTSHAGPLSSRKSPEMVQRGRNDRVFIGKRVH